MVTPSKKKYAKKLKYIRVDFYLKDESLWEYACYLREKGISVAGLLRDHLSKSMQDDKEYFLTKKDSQN